MGKERSRSHSVHTASAGVCFILFPAYSPYVRIAGIRVGEYEPAYRGVGDHCIAFRQPDPESLPAIKKVKNIFLESVVRTAGISCGRLDYLYSVTGRVVLIVAMSFCKPLFQITVQPQRGSFCKSEPDGPADKLRLVGAVTIALWPGFMHGYREHSETAFLPGMFRRHEIAQ